MASGDTLLQIPPQDFFPEGGGPSGGPFGLVGSGLAQGLAFSPGFASAAYALKRLPKTASLGTGLTFKLLLAVDPNNPESSKASAWGVSVGLVGTTTAYYPPDLTVLGTEATGIVTHAATAGQDRELSIAVAAANAGGALADTWVALRVRRLGAGTNDTSRVRVLLLGVAVLDT